MTSYLRGTAVHSIQEGKIDEFKKLVGLIIDRVAATEPNTISYEWFLSQDHSKCHVVQVYKDSDAVLFHLKNIGDLLGPFHVVAPLTELKVFGNPSSELRQALELAGAQFYEHLMGVTRDPT